MSRIPSSTNHRHWPALVACLAMLALPAVAQAAIDEYPIDRLLEGFNGVLGTWSDAVKTVADRLFWSLALISLTWTMCMMLFKRADFGELFAELVRFIIFTGLFWWLLDNGGGADGLIASVLESGRLMGADGSAGDGRLRPSALLDSAFHVFNEVAAKSASDEWKDADKIVGLMLASVIIALVALAAVSMMLVIVMTWILAYAGLFLLGFGGARWTSGVAVNYYKHVLAVGMSYFVMLLLAGIGETFLKEYSDAVAGDITLPHLAILLSAAIVLVALLVRIPALVSSMVLGARFGGAAGTSFSGHVMAVGGTAIATGVGQASSGAQALYSAYSAPSAAPPPAPMISMPTIQMPTAPAAPSAASAPTPTPVISVHHLDGTGISPPTVTLNTQGMYPPPAGAEQSSVFGATPSAQEVARAQVQAAPGSAGGAGGAGAAAVQAVPAAAGTATTATTAGTDTDSATDRTTLPPSLDAAHSATARGATQIPSLDAEALQRSPREEPSLSAANLAASTASLPASPASPMSGSRDAPLDTDDAKAETGDLARRPPEKPQTGFSSFASQPLSGSALPPTERANALDRDGVARRGDATDGSARAGSTTSLPQSTGAQPAGTSSPVAIGRPVGSTSADVAPSLPRASSATPSPDKSQSSGAAPSGHRDRRSPEAPTSTMRGDHTARSEHRASSPAPDGTGAASPASVARVIPAADRPQANEPAHASTPASTTVTSATTEGRHKAGWLQRILRALRLRFRKHGSNDDAR